MDYTSIIKNFISYFAKNWIGVVGAVTGVTSLVWHILKTRVKLEITSFTYEPYSNKQNFKLVSKILVKNKGNKDTSMEEIFITCNNRIFENPDVTENYTSPDLPVSIKGNSSRKLRLIFSLTEEEYNGLKSKNKLITIHVKHTYGKLKKSKIR